MRLPLALALVAGLSTHAWAVESDGTEPDPALTPGAVETQLVDGICHHRPPERRHATTAEKNAVYKAYGLPTHHSAWCAASGCDLDDRVPIECGGSNVAANLWPQKNTGAYNQVDKNRLEGLCKKLVCQGKITPAEGQTWFLGDWKAEYDRRFGAIKGE